WSFEDPAFRLDVINAAMVAILLPMLSLGSMRLSSLRRKLRAERSALAGALLEVQRLATHDELTGLANRRDMQHRLDTERARFERFGHPFSVAVIDLDHFKRINDAYGHAGGDEVLRSFAEAASRMLRATDVLGRWGGEEFLLLMPETRSAAAGCSVERVLSKVMAVPEEDGPAVSFSAGVVEYRAGETVDQVVARADAAMYAAKRAGRGRVVRA
ncbi:MAG: GGDEF domain-containing protein, partial [Lysobacter spongiicola]|nr:GGDEF domain-containing protein [Lysobacter spongiicola]